MTFAERLLWKHLRDKQIDGWHFRRQHPIGQYILDFFCAKAKLVIEIDGDSHAAQGEYDSERSRWLAKQKHYRVIRFMDRDVQKDLEGVVAAIREALAESQRLPPP